MSRDSVNKKIKAALGSVPKMFDQIPEQLLEAEWDRFQTQFLTQGGPINAKNRALIALGVAAANNSHYTTYFQVELARVFGATQEEIQSALSVASTTIGFSTYINSLPLDLLGQFQKETSQVVNSAKSTARAA